MNADLIFIFNKKLEFIILLMKSSKESFNFFDKPGSWTVDKIAAMSSSSFLASWTFWEASLALFWAWLAFDNAWDRK